MKLIKFLKRALAACWQWVKRENGNLAEQLPEVTNLNEKGGKEKGKKRTTNQGGNGCESVPYYTEQMQLLISNLTKNYLLRRNRLTGGIEYKRREGTDKPWQMLSKEVQNSMTIDALLNGIDAWDKDMTRYMESTYVSDYDPIAEWLGSLPEWDGTDHIRSFARRLPTDNTHWEDDFHRWFLGMVAQWQKEAPLYGNALVPLLIGAQGDGKSTFCKMILPKDLQLYYVDRLDFTNRNEAVKMLSRFALINLDEYDQLTKRQNAFLKHLLQKTDVKSRKMFQEMVGQQKRYASFIATTNDPMPLTDTTGSRRFLCIRTAGTIYTRDTVNYRQMYAQALAEINRGERTWFNRDDEKRIQQQNADFQQLNDIEQVFFDMFQKPRKWETGKWLSPTALLHAMHEQCSGVSEDARNLHRLGRLLKKFDFERKRLHSHVEYKVK